MDRDLDGDFVMVVVATDQPAAIQPEPLDLDVVLRVDGEPGSWVSSVPLGRTYKPLNVEKDTASLFRLHVYDWSGEDVNAWKETHLVGDPDALRVEADIYIEFYFVGREYVEGEDWYHICQYRWRFVSEHPDWQVSESQFDFVALGGIKMTLPIFPQSDPE